MNKFSDENGNIHLRITAGIGNPITTHAPISTNHPKQIENLKLREELKKLIDEIPEENLYLAEKSLNSVIDIGSFSKALDSVINFKNKEEQ